MKSALRSLSMASVLAAACICLVLAPTVGCDGQRTAAALTQTLGSAAASIAALQGNTALAQQLVTDTSVAAKAITDWKSGSASDVAIEALSIVEADLNLIPGTSQYAPLIDIAIATTQSILSLLPAPSDPSTANKVAHVRSVHLGHAPPRTSKEFKAQWNGVILTHPDLSAATLK